jgi:Ca2+-dependent lipid-binding protein
MFRGVDLLAFDETGTSDPYVLMRIGSIQHQTDVIYHSLAPMWNENFLFSINSIDKDLHLTVVDKDPEFDDLMANYRIHLSSIPLQVGIMRGGAHPVIGTVKCFLIN